MMKKRWHVLYRKEDPENDNIFSYTFHSDLVAENYIAAQLQAKMVLENLSKENKCSIDFFVVPTSECSWERVEYQKDQKDQKDFKVHKRAVRSMIFEHLDWYEDHIEEMTNDNEDRDLIDMAIDDAEHLKESWNRFETIHENFNELLQDLIHQDTAPRDIIYVVICYIREEILHEK